MESSSTTSQAVSGDRAIRLLLISFRSSRVISIEATSPSSNMVSTPPISIYWFISRDTFGALCRMIPSNIVVETSTVSGKLNTSTPVSMSRSKLSRMGGVVSLMYAEACRASDGSISAA